MSYELDQVDIYGWLARRLGGFFSLNWFITLHFDNQMVVGIFGDFCFWVKHLSIFFESLILAQDERWRYALSMQVERSCPLDKNFQIIQ